MKKLSPAERKVLNLIRVHGLLSRAQILQYTETSMTKIAYITEQLDQKGLVEKIKGTSSGGRSPNLLQVRNDLCFALGVEIGTQYLRAVIINANGDILGHAKIYEALQEKRNIAVQDLHELAFQALQAANVSWDAITGVGVGITGIVDENRGICLFLPNAPEWQNMPVVETFRETTGLQEIYVTDSVRGMAVSEGRYGACREVSNFIVIGVGVGLGAGIVIDKKILTGSRGVMGEFGHMYIGGTNEICVCGNYGCLESLASGWAVVRRAKEAIERGVVTSMHDYIDSEKSIQISDIIHVAKNGDKFAINLLEETANYLSLGFSMLINLLNPQMIVIAGGLAEGAGDLLMQPLVRGVRAKTLPWLQQDIHIRLSELGEYSAARGAATLAMDKTFEQLF